jgi:hypothetical protein
MNLEIFILISGDDVGRFAMACGLSGCFVHAAAFGIHFRS